MNRTYFSIIIPTLNEEKFVGRLLESIASQTKKDFEVIVVDGASKDKTLAVIETYRRRISELKTIKSPRALLPLQRNLGATKASGEWLIFVDADSVFLPYFLDRITLYIQSHNPSLFTTWFSPDSETTGDAILTTIGNLSLDGSIMLHRPFSPGPLTIVKKSVFDLVGGYDESRSFNEDADFSLRLAKAGMDLSVLHETLWVLSLRRFRKEGTLKVMQQYIRAALPVLIFKRPMKQYPGYIMGGQIYTTKKKLSMRANIKTYETKLKKLARELFS